jgi:hypothetical protein
MTAKQAYALLVTKNPAVKVGKVFEYDSVFVFHLAPDMLSLSKKQSHMMDSLISINKTTGEIRDFKPFYISIEEYRSGKEIPASVYKR